MVVLALLACLLTFAFAAACEIAAGAAKRRRFLAGLDRDMRRLSESPGWVVPEQSHPASER